MNIQTVILLAIIVVICVFAGKRVYKTFSLKGGGCACHGGGDEPASPKRVRVTDTDKSHYPYEEDLSISGMTCDHCVKNVENALNAIEGTWAKVDLESGAAHVLSKQPIDNEQLKKAVTDAGYYIRTF